VSRLKRGQEEGKGEEEEKIIDPPPVASL